MVIKSLKSPVDFATSSIHTGITIVSKLPKGFITLEPNCKFGTPHETGLELIKKAESSYYERKEEQRRRDQAAEETRRQQQAQWDSKGIHLVI